MYRSFLEPNTVYYNAFMSETVMGIYVNEEDAIEQLYRIESGG